MQYKLLYQIINCNYYLKKCKIKESEKCTYCNNIDDPIHYFVLCTKTFIFWQDLVKWWNRNNTLKIEIQRDDFIENIIFGFMDLEKKHISLNYLIYYAKYFVYSKKQFNRNEVDFYKFLSYFSFKIDCELKVNRMTKIQKLLKEELQNMLEWIKP